MKTYTTYPNDLNEKSKDLFFLFRYQNKIYIRRYNTKHPDLSCRSAINRPFLFVEYHHPCMTTHLEIDIPPEYYLEENELLFPAFVYFLLETQSSPFVFTMDYEIHIVDHQLQSFVLQSHQSIQIHHDGYVII